jgi:hypothetical protein
VLGNFNTDVKEKFKLYLSQFGLQFKEIQQKENEEDINQAVSDKMKETKYKLIVFYLYGLVITIIFSLIKYNNKEKSDVKRSEFTG